MVYNKLTKPETPDIEQCRQCKHASEKKIWCCKFGFYFDKPLISAPSKKLILPSHHKATEKTKILNSSIRTAVPCNDKNVEADYEIYSGRYAGLPPSEKAKPIYAIISKEIYIQRRQKCLACPDRLNCPMRGCMRKEALIKEVWNCPKGK